MNCRKTTDSTLRCGQLPTSDNEDDALLQHNRRIDRRIRKPVHQMWDDNHIGWLMQVIFAEPPLTMSPMPEITGDEEPAANKIEPEQEAAVQATGDRRRPTEQQRQ